MSKLKFLFVLIFLAVAVAGAVAAFFYRFNQPVGSEGKVEIVINPGESIQEIGKKLDEAKLMDSNSFVLYVRFGNLTTKIQAGRYEIPLPLSPVRIIELLQHGTFDVRLTFLEGWRREQYLEYALSKLAVDDDAFSAEFLNETEGLEGYLFPDTYSVSINTTARELVAKLRANFDDKYSDNIRALEEVSGLSQTQIVNIAAMLERETLNDLKFGDVLKQKLLGEDYRYTGGEKERPVFVRYIVPVVAQHYENGNRVDEPDIIVASGVFKPDGMLVQYAVDSRHYEKA